MSLTMCNDVAEASPQKLTVYLVKAGDSPAYGSFVGTFPVGSEPTVFPDSMRNFGKVLLKRDF